METLRTRKRAATFRASLSAAIQRVAAAWVARRLARLRMRGAIFSHARVTIPCELDTRRRAAAITVPVAHCATSVEVAVDVGAPRRSAGRIAAA